MITVKNAKTLEGKTTEISIPSSQEFFLDAEGLLTRLPALIDPSPHFLLQNAEAYLQAGITTLLIPSDPAHPSSTFREFQAKSELLSSKVHFPLHLTLFIGDGQRDAAEVSEEVGKMKNKAAGIWVDGSRIYPEVFDRLFQIAAQHALVISAILGNERKERQNAMGKLLKLAEKYNTEIAFMDLTYPEELENVREAKKSELMVYGATTLPELVKDHIWEAIQDDTIEMVGSGSTPPSLVLPLLLNSFHHRKITLEKIVAVTRRNIENIYHLKQNSDIVLIHLDKSQKAADKTLKGWPIFTIANGLIFR